MYDLKPCPFCGGDPEFKTFKEEGEAALAVFCSKCGSHGQANRSRLIPYMRASKWHATRLDHVIAVYGKEAAEAWNRRANNGKN